MAPTSSITKEFVIKSDEAAKRLLDLKSPEKKEDEKEDDSYERGQELLKSLRLK